MWKVAIHDRGWSSPVIWGDQVWMTTATGEGRKLFAVCVDKVPAHERKGYGMPIPKEVRMTE